LQILGFALFIITILESVLGSIKSFILTETTNRIDQKLGAIIIDHLFRLPLEYFDKRPVGELANRISELEKIRNFLTSQGISSILDALFSFVYVLILFMYSAKLAIVALSVVPIQILIIIYGSPIFRMQHRNAAVDNAGTQSYLVETVSGIQTIKTQNAETSSRWKWQNFYSKFISSSYKRNITAISLNQLTSVLQKISQLIVIWFGASMVLKGELTLGQLIAFRIIAGYVTQPILRLSSVWQQYQEIKISFERLGDIINTSREDDADDLGKIQLPEVSGKIEFRDVSFSFLNTLSPNLNTINCDLKEKSFVGIVGKSGSGKSTFCKLISRLYNPTNGRIFIDGFDISKVQLSSLRRQIGIVSQDPLLFSGTIMENITFGDKGFSEKEIIDTAQICMAHDFIMDLPLGYNTKITERGTTLSGGQRQRISILRALVKNPKILILDEATSALDTETESLFIKNLLAKRRSTTILMITHRLINIRKADKILVFEKGFLSSQGKHEELIENDLTYSSLYKNV
jgi:ATP-binding cassette subfamily B protein